MAIEYVDATQLDSDLTSVANAIRAKSGGSSSLAFPSGFVSEIQAIPSGGGGNAIMATVDVVFDNISRGEAYIPFDYQRDNYALNYRVIETGKYVDGVLVMDESPVVPLSQNIPLTGIRTALHGQVGYTGKIGTTDYSSASNMIGSYAVVRSSVSTYAAAYSSNQPVYENGYIRIRSQYNFGKSGYFYKYRVTIFAWDNDQTLALSTVNVT